MIDWNKPSITDWINALATLAGIPIIIWGVIKLFIKDKLKDRKLLSLENIALSQNELITKMGEQIEELSRQTSEFQYQSELMKESNDLTNRQIELQNDIFLHNQVNENLKFELQRKEHLNKIKPHFTFSRGSSNATSFSTTYLNKGHTAKKLELKGVENSLVSFQRLDYEKEINMNEEITINGWANAELTSKTSNQITFEVLLSYEDIDGNKYHQKIGHSNHRYTIGPPLLTT